MGDRIIKHVKGYNISSSLENCKVYVKDFPCERVRCIKVYVKPTLIKNADHIFMYVSTNQLLN